MHQVIKANNAFTVYLVSLVVVSLRQVLSSTADSGLSLERGRFTLSETDLGRSRRGGKSCKLTHFKLIQMSRNTVSCVES